MTSDPALRQPIRAQLVSKPKISTSAKVKMERRSREPGICEEADGGSRATEREREEGMGNDGERDGRRGTVSCRSVAVAAAAVATTDRKRRLRHRREKSEPRQLRYTSPAGLFLFLFLQGKASAAAARTVGGGTARTCCIGRPGFSRCQGGEVGEFLFLHHPLPPIVQRGGLASCADAFFAGNAPIVASACLRTFGTGIEASRFLDAGDPFLSFTSGSV